MNIPKKSSGKIEKNIVKQLCVVAILVIGVMILNGCSSKDSNTERLQKPTPIKTITPTPELTPTPIASPTPSPTLTPDEEEEVHTLEYYLDQTPYDWGYNEEERLFSVQIRKDDGSTTGIMLASDDSGVSVTTYKWNNEEEGQSYSAEASGQLADTVSIINEAVAKVDKAYEDGKQAAPSPSERPEFDVNAMYEAYLKADPEATEHGHIYSLENYTAVLEIAIDHAQRLLKEDETVSEIKWDTLEIFPTKWPSGYWFDLIAIEVDENGESMSITGRAGHNNPLGEK